MKQVNPLQCRKLLSICLKPIGWLFIGNMWIGHRLSRECLEGVKLDELSSTDAQRLQTEYNSNSVPLSSLTGDQLQQLIEDLGVDV